jgi:glycosyltransferase A (GT-A) superfamily protein (DUF2064 family)
MISEPRDGPCLIIFFRRPKHGIGKRRIARVLGDRITLTLAEHLLATTLEDASHWMGPVYLSPENSDDLDWAHALKSPCYKVIDQSTGNLGERINAVDRATRNTGNEHLIFIGSDAPVLSA